MAGLNIHDYPKWDGVTNHRNCIYAYVNMINGKMYVGQTVHLKQRHIAHCKLSENKCAIDKAIKKYGKENFIVYVLEKELPDHDAMNEREMFYIKEFDSFKNGYNNCLGGNGAKGHTSFWKGKKIPAHVAALLLQTGKTPWNKGIPRSEEEKEKISRSKKGSIPWNAGTKGVMKSWNKGKKCPQISEALKGRIITPEARAKLSAAHKGKSPANKGVPATPEQRLKMSLARRGKAPYNKTKVLKVDIEGNILAIYNSVVEARTTEHISLCLGQYHKRKHCFYIKPIDYETINSKLLLG